MNYLFFNDTGNTYNPGCQGTVRCLKELYAENGWNLVQSFPIGYGNYLFSSDKLSGISFRMPSVFRKVQNRFSRRFLSERKDDFKWSWEYEAAGFRFEDWKRNRDRMYLRYRSLFDKAEAIVINGEGTIHHNQCSALTLIAWASVAAEANLRVLLVNCSIQSMAEELLEEIRNCVEYVSVREPRSASYLEQFGIRSNAGSDALFLLGRSRIRMSPEVNASRQKCLFTPGVLGAHGVVNENTVETQIRNLQRHGYKVSYATIETEDIRFESIAEELGAEVLPLGFLHSGNIVGALNDYHLVVTGRYHVCIYAFLAGTRVIALESNTHKVNGLMELVGADGDMVLGARDALHNKSMVNSADLCVSANRIDICTEAAIRNFPVTAFQGKQKA